MCAKPSFLPYLNRIVLHQQFLPPANGWQVAHIFVCVFEMDEFQDTVFEGKDDDNKTYFAEDGARFDRLMDKHNIDIDVRGVLWSNLRRWYDSFDHSRPGFGMEVFRPLDIDLVGCLNGGMNHIELEQDMASKLWGDDRLKFNRSTNRIWITNAIKECISVFRDRFELKRTFWSSILVYGLSGSGKSVAIALSASYLRGIGMDVYWFRTPKDFNYGKWADFASRRGSSLPPMIVFVDQIDKMDQKDMEKVIRLGDSSHSFFTIGCGSGNIGMRKSSSETTRIADPYEFAPSIEQSEFQLVMKMGSIPAGVADMKTSDMLQFSSKNIGDLYIATSGHFLSITRIRHYLDSKYSLSESWKLAISDLTAVMSDNIALDLERSGDFYVLLHRLFFTIEDSYPVISEQEYTDARFFFRNRVFSPLFAQAYHSVLLKHSYSINYIAKLESTGLKYSNKSVLGFFVERLVINNFDALADIAFQCLIDSRIIPATYLQSDLPKSASSEYSYSENMPIPQRIQPSSDSQVCMYHFIPTKWNEQSIDLVQVYTYNSSALLIGNSISLETPQKHAKSISWFSQSVFFVNELKNRNFESVITVLLFTASQNMNSKITVEPEHYEELKVKYIYDFPLEDAVDPILWRQIEDKLNVNKYNDGIRKLEIIPNPKRIRCRYDSGSGECEEFIVEGRKNCKKHMGKRRKT